MSTTPFGETAQGLAARLMDRAAEKSPAEKSRVDEIARRAIYVAAGGDGTRVDGKDIRHGAFPVLMDDPRPGPHLEVWDPAEHALAMIRHSFAAFDRIIGETDRRNLLAILRTRVSEINEERRGASGRGGRRFRATGTDE